MILSANGIMAKNIFFELLMLMLTSEVIISDSSCDEEPVTTEKCYEGLGCVRLTPEWFHPKYRPENVLPADRYIVNTVFVHWTLDKKHNVTPKILGSDLRGSHINCCLKILVHDFTSNGYTGWIQHLSRAILTNPDTSGSNIVAVNWAAGAEPPYLLAVANARLVALEIVQFLNNLKALCKLDPRKVHIIGHGLGGHIAGYVGKLTRLRRITALDPSGPYFTKMPPQVKLHIDDADYVEVIHSDASSCGQGTIELLGHIDFFPNGGKNQPGCDDLGRKVTTVTREDLQLGQTLSACSHKRSLKYYIESLLNKSCKFIAVACNSFKDFVKGKCLSCGEKSENCAVLHATSRPRKFKNANGFYFITSNSSPFCGEMIKVVLALKSSPKGSDYVKGSFNITIPQSIGDVTFSLNENRALRYLKTDEEHVFLVFRTSPPPLILPVQSLTITWVQGFFRCFLCSPPEIGGLMLQLLSEDPKEKGQWFCPVSDSSEKADDTAMSFKPCKVIT